VRAWLARSRKQKRSAKISRKIGHGAGISRAGYNLKGAAAAWALKAGKHSVVALAK